MAGSGEQGVDPVAIVAEQVVPAKPAIGLGMADHRLDRRSSLELAPHGRGQAAPVAGEDDLGRAFVVVAFVVVAFVAPIGIGPRDRDTGHGLCLVDGGLQGVAVIGIAGEGLGGQEQALPVGRRDRHLGAELVALVSLAFGDADHFGGMQAVELVVVPRFLDEQPLDQPEQAGEAGLLRRVAGDLAADVAIDPAEIGAQALELSAQAPVLLGVGVASGLGRRRLGQPGVALAQRQAGRLGLGHQGLEGPEVEPAVGGMGDGLLLNRGVDGDPLQAAGLDRAAGQRRLDRGLLNTRSISSGPMRLRQRVISDGSIGSACWKRSKPQKNCQ